MWILGCSCSLTRFVKLQVIQDMKASSIMAGLQTSSASMGKNLPRELLSDAASNINVLRSTLPLDDELMTEKEFKGLDLRLQKEGTRIFVLNDTSPIKLILSLLLPFFILIDSLALCNHNSGVITKCTTWVRRC